MLSEFRDRLLAGRAEGLLLDKLLERCRAVGFLKARGPQRTDSPHVLAALRVRSRLALVAETLRAALNALATVAPDWRPGLAPREGYERDGKRREDSRLPRAKAAREAYAQAVGADGFRVLEAVDAPGASEAVRTLPRITTLRRPWQRHYERIEPTSPAPRKRPAPRVRFKANRDVPRAAEGIESPSDPDARYRHKRDTPWTGSMVHVSETCEPTAPHLLTHVHTTTAAVHDAQGTTPMQPALAEQDVLPSEHLVDAAYSSAALLVQSQAESGITLRGPTRPSPGWQAQVEGAYTVEHLEVDWAHQRVRCPQGNWSAAWWEHGAQTSSRRIFVESAREDCQAWPARAWVGSEEGRQQSQQRAGGEGPLSQGVRGLGLRDARSRGLTTTHVQHVATAAAMNVERIVAWLNERPRAKTRTSRVAALAPACGMP